MKTTRTYTLATLFVGLTVVAQAQNWSGGVIVDLPFNIDRTGTTFRSGSSTFYMNGGVEGNRLRPGVFVRYDRPKWLVQADVQYVDKFSIGFYSSTDQGGSGSDFAKGNQTALRLSGGYKPAPWLRIQAGVGAAHTAWNSSNYVTYANELEAQIRRGHPDANRLQAEADQYRTVARVIDSYQRIHLTAQAGVGVDLGGLTLDFLRTQSLTPALNGVAGTSEIARQSYGYYSLRAGYRLFPLKKYLLASRKSNRAYQKLQSEIPFYRNEFHVGVGNQAEDINAGVIYEASYTRFLSRRFGLTGAVSLAKREASRGLSTLTPRNGFIAAMMGRFLPLYTRRHQIAVSAGPQLSIQGATITGIFNTNTDPQGRVTYARLTTEPSRVVFGGQLQVDYQVAVTDRLPIGLWVRTGDYGTFYGLQAGYRF